MKDGLKMIGKSGTVNRKPQKIHPSKVYIYRDEGSEPLSETIWFSYFVQFIRGVLLVIIISSIATFVGFLTLRLFEMNAPLYTLKEVFDKILRSSLPSSEQMTAVLIVSIIFMVIFYGHRFFDKNITKDRPSMFTHFLAGISVVIAVDLLLFQLSWYSIIHSSGQVNAWVIETLGAQGASFTAIILLIPLFTALIRINNFPKLPIPKLQPKAASFINWLRFLIVVFALTWACVYFGVAGAIANSKHFIVDYLPVSFGNRLTLEEFGAILMVIATASIFFWAPKTRQMRPFWIFRLLLFLACIVGVCLIYIQAPVGEIYIEVVLFSALNSILAVPLCRILS